MEQDFFTNLPSEITTKILSRLSLRSISISKCVCRPWLNLLESVDFVKSHFPQIKTPPALALLKPVGRNSTRLTVFEFEVEDEADVERHALRDHPLPYFEIPHGNSETSHRAQSTNGLLSIHSSLKRHIHICNPFTREYIQLCCPQAYSSFDFLIFGFGVSISGQYKVVCISDEYDFQHVYTLRTGTWRPLEASATSGFSFCFQPQIVYYGNLHWTVFDSAETLWICALDLETECFSIFSTPSPSVDGNPAVDILAMYVELHVLRDCLCFSYRWDDTIVVWLMKEYQVGESWTMDYQISIDFELILDYGFEWSHVYIWLVKVFENGDALLLLNQKCLFYYHNKTRITEKFGMLTEHGFASAMVYTPSLFSLKNFGVENVISY